MRNAALPTVSPRYLAGTLYGDAAPALEPLEVAGWPHLTDEEHTTRYFAPDGRRCVTFHPEQQEIVAPGLYSLWRAWARPCAHAPLTWAAQFTSDTPTEIIAAFTTALATDSLVSGQSPLTARETEVLKTARDGSSVATIAATLFLSEGTVRNHLSAAIGKTGAENRGAAVRIAEENGWL